MIKKLLLLVCCAALIGDCASPQRKLIFPPIDEEQPETDDINAVRVVLLGESFSETLPKDPKARFDWEVVWDKKMLEGSQSQGAMCLSNNDDNCLKIIKYEFKAMQIGEALIEFRLKEKDNIVESFTSRVIVAKNSAREHDELPKPPVR